MIILATIAVRCIVFWNVFVRCDIFLFGFYSSSHFFNTLYYLSLWQINVSMYKTQQKPNCQISVSGIAMGSLVTWAWLFQMQHFRRFSSAAVPYIVFSTIGLLSDNCASVHIGNISTYWFFYVFCWICQTVLTWNQMLILQPSDRCPANLSTELRNGSTSRNTRNQNIRNIIKSE